MERPASRKNALQSTEKPTAEPTGAVARRSWALRGVAYCGVAEEARTRGFVPPAFAGFAFVAAVLRRLKYASVKGASRSRRRRANSARPRDFVQVLDVGAYGAVDALDLRVRRLDEVVLVRGVGAAAVAESEVTRGEPQRIAREHVARPGAGVARQENRVDPGASVHRILHLDERRAGGGAGGAVGAGPVPPGIPR